MNFELIIYGNWKNAIRFIILNSSFIIFLSSCSFQKQIAKSAKENVLNNKALQTAHVGISIFDPAENKYLYNYQGDKYFVPASNTKIPTCYAAMKYLGDSLVGLRYNISKSKMSSDQLFLSIKPTGDPTLLHPDFLNHPVWQFLQKSAKDFGFNAAMMDTVWQTDHWGNGWSWNDYDASYMPERSAFPIYGNVIEIEINSLDNRKIYREALINDYTSSDNFVGYPAHLFKTQNSFFDSLVNPRFFLMSEKNFNLINPYVSIKRTFLDNKFEVSEANSPFKKKSIPFITKGIQTAKDFIKDSLNIHLATIVSYDSKEGKKEFRTISGYFVHGAYLELDKWNTIHSQPTDSLLESMMHRSDNFFAEQSLLMVSNERLGMMNDAKIIDTILKTDFKDLPQKPRWADGSGLSRYNLFTPQDFVAILNKMKNEFGMERIKVIFPTGGEGTISSYYKADSGYIYAKTGTLSGVVAFSGYLYTRKGKLLIFSALVNNHQASATDVRRAIEKFLQGIRNRY